MGVLWSLPGHVRASSAHDRLWNTMCYGIDDEGQDAISLHSASALFLSPSQYFHRQRLFALSSFPFLFSHSC